MYFYVYNGQLYWGRHQILAPHRNVLTWIFRNKPMKLSHKYISSSRTFMAFKSPGSFSNRVEYTVCMYNSNLPGSAVHHLIQISEGFCYFIDDYGHKTIVASTDKNEKNRQEFKNMFKNRLKEYKGRYFLPINKHSNYA